MLPHPHISYYASLTNERSMPTEKLLLMADQIPHGKILCDSSYDKSQFVVEEESEE